jgi:hypothetical protein
LALETPEVSSWLAYRPPKRELRSKKNIIGFRNAPFRKVAMETPSAKQDAPIKCPPEERLAAPWTFPIGQPRGKKEVGDKS